MKLKAIYHKDELCLATESGEIIENTEGCTVFATGMDARAGKRVDCRFAVIVNLEVSEKIVDADERAVRILPAASQNDPFDFMKDHYDFDPLDYEDYPCDDEEEFEDMLCDDCDQDLCLNCGKCCTPACEAEACDCPTTSLATHT